MAKVKIKGTVVGYHFKHMEAGQIHWALSSAHRVELDDETLHIQPFEAEVEVPDINVVAAQVQGLEAEKLRALAEYQQRVADLNERLSKLLAIEVAS